MTRPPRRSLIVLLILLPSLLVVPAGAAAAHDNPNTPIVFDVDETFPAPNLSRECGVPITAHVTGTVMVTAHPSGADLVRQRTQYTFSGSGGSVTLDRVENARVSITVAPICERIA